MDTCGASRTATSGHTTGSRNTASGSTRRRTASRSRSAWPTRNRQPAFLTIYSGTSLMNLTPCGQCTLQLCRVTRTGGTIIARSMSLNLPDQYHNGGIWPWVGGLYVAALTRAGRLDKAGECLAKLAQANQLGRQNEWEFNEWLHGVSGEPRGSADQCWSAGMYIYAYTCVKQGREPVFDVLESDEVQLQHNASL